MHKIFFLVLSLLCFQLSYTQYESGYIVTKNGENQIGLLKNQNWNRSPENISFKANADANEQLIKIENLTEFGIGETVKFIISEVELDVSSENINYLTNTKNPQFESRVLALRKLVDGKISLYEYQFSNGNRYYIKQPNQNFEALVFKKYRVSNNSIGTNQHYKQQLSLLLSNKKDELLKDIAQVTYSRKSLSKLINQYNLLNNVSSTSYVESIKKKAKLRVGLYGGLEQTSVSYRFRNTATLNPSFNDISRSLFGAELELVVLNNRLGLFSNYSIKSKVDESVVLQTSLPDVTQTATIEFNNNTLAIGARGYIPTIKNLEIVVSAGITIEYVKDFTITLDVSQIDENFDRNGSTEFIGVGLAYKKVFAEARFFSNKMFIENVSVGIPTDDSNVNFRLGYKFL